VHKKPTEPTEQAPDVPTIVQPMVDELKQAHKTKIPDEKAPRSAPSILQNPPSSTRISGVVTTSTTLFRSH